MEIEIGTLEQFTRGTSAAMIAKFAVMKVWEFVWGIRFWWEVRIGDWGFIWKLRNEGNGNGVRRE